MNRIHRAKQRKTGGRGAAFLTAFFLLIGCLGIPDMEVRAESLSVRASASSVKIGDTVTISITVPGGISATVNLTYPSNLFSYQSASETANANGGTVSMTLGGYGGTDTATTGTVTFKAKSAGTATFSASAPVAGNQEGDQVSLGGGSASVTVKNEASSGNNNGNGSGNNSGGNNNGNSSSGNNSDDDEDDEDDNSNKSADNSLSSLTLSAGKLSPSFRYNIVNYTATVDYNVTSVAVNAKTSNANATIESVKGGQSLSVGENRIQVVVKAENGVTATYTITVTRKAQGEADKPEDDPDDAEDEPEDDPQDTDPSAASFVVDGKTLYPSETIPEGLEEPNFERGEITLWGQTYPSLVDTFSAGELQLIYLAEEGGENGGLYLLLSSQPQEAYSYVRLNAKKGFIIVLPDGDGSVPGAYAAMPTVFDTDGYGKIDAWFSESGRDLALVYAVNQEGVRGWYTIDTQSLSYVRYQEPAVSAMEPEPSTEQEEKAEPADDTELKELKKQNHLIIGIAAILVLILLIVIILMAVARRSGDDGGDDEEILAESVRAQKEQEKRRRDTSVRKRDEPEERMSREPRGTLPQEKVKKQAPVQKRYDKSMFGADYLRDVMADLDDEDENEPDAAFESKRAPEPRAEVQPKRVPEPRAEVQPKREAAPREETEPEEEFEPKAFIDIGELERKWGLSSPADDKELTSMETGLAKEMEREMAQEVADQISRIADPAPMQAVTTHKDKDDEDLEFIDL